MTPWEGRCPDHVSVTLWVIAAIVGTAASSVSVDQSAGFSREAALPETCSNEAELKLTLVQCAGLCLASNCPGFTQVNASWCKVCLSRTSRSVSVGVWPSSYLLARTVLLFPRLDTYVDLGGSPRPGQILTVSGYPTAIDRFDLAFYELFKEDIAFRISHRNLTIHGVPATVVNCRVDMEWQIYHSAPDPVAVAVQQPFTYAVIFGSQAMDIYLEGYRVLGYNKRYSLVLETRWLYVTHDVVITKVTLS